MNPFENFGIKHLSPSSCNTFAAQPALFVMEKVLNIKTGVGPAAFRGSAAEDGIVFGLMEDADIDACIAKAEASFDGRCAAAGLLDDAKADKERKALAGFVEQGLECLRPYGRPSSTQGRVDYPVAGLSVALMGYWDLHYAERNLIVDLKTTHMVPGSPKTNHCSQVALYAIAGGGANAEAHLAYISTKKSAVYAVPDLPAHLKRLERIALTIQRLLSVSDDPKVIAGLVVPDTESFYFADPATREAAWKVWGV
jgi:hypothetical protein